MKLINNQTETPQAGVEEQQSEAGVVEPQFENNGWIINHLRVLGVDNYQQRVLVSYASVVKTGLIKLAFVKGNRKVNNLQVNKLIKDLQNRKENRFSHAGILIPLELVHKNNPGVVAVDASGKEITSEDADYKKTMVVADAQHRVVACIENNFDMDFELLPYDGDLFDLIEILNSYDKNWQNSDLKNMNRERGRITNPLYEDAEQALLWFGGVSLTYLEYMFSFKKDAAKKSDLIKGVDNVVYTEELAVRGRLFLGALLKSFASNREIRRVELIHSLKFAYENVGDLHHPTFTQDMTCFLASLPKEKRETICKLLEGKEFGSLNTFVLTEFKCFKTQHAADMGKLFTDTKQEIEELIREKQKQAGLAILPLKEATPWELISNRKAVAFEKEKQKQVKSKTVKSDDLKTAILDRLGGSHISKPLMDLFRDKAKEVGREPVVNFINSLTDEQANDLRLYQKKGEEKNLEAKFQTIWENFQ